MGDADPTTATASAEAPTRSVPPSRDDQPATPAVLIHIHKTAGSSLRSELIRQYRDFEYAICDGVKAAERFMKTPASDRARYGLIFGHAPFFNPVEGTGHEPRYISMVRRPLERVISFYRHIKRMPEHPLRQGVKGKDPSVEDLLDQKFIPFDNEQVRFLAGPKAWDRAFGKVCEKDLERAIANIDEHNILVGIQEQFDRSLLYYAEKLNWDTNHLGGIRVNAAPETDSFPELDGPTQARLEELNRFDAALYEAVVERFPKD